jgi:hypothetical protein
MKRVIVHIDRLVLTGFRRDDQHAIAAGLQQEFEQMFSDRDTVLQLGTVGDVSRLKVDGVNIDQGAKPQRIGESVAQGIGKEIWK